MNGNYRKCVGITVYKDHKVLLCERRDLPGAWQFPQGGIEAGEGLIEACLLYTSPSPRDAHESRMPSSA